MRAIQQGGISQPSSSLVYLYLACKVCRDHSSSSGVTRRNDKTLYCLRDSVASLTGDSHSWHWGFHLLQRLPLSNHARLSAFKLPFTFLIGDPPDNRRLLSGFLISPSLANTSPVPSSLYHFSFIVCAAHGVPEYIIEHLWPVFHFGYCNISSSTSTWLCFFFPTAFLVWQSCQTFLGGFPLWFFKHICSGNFDVLRYLALILTGFWLHAFSPDPWIGERVPPLGLVWF